MAKPLNIIVCGSLVPDPLQTLEPVQTPQGPGLKNEQMLPSVLDPWAACALYEAAALAKTRPDSEGTIVTAIMTPNELLDHPALIALLGAVAAFSLCFFAAWCYIAIRGVRTLKILFHMEKLGYKRSPCGAWSPGTSAT